MEVQNSLNFPRLPFNALHSEKVKNKRKNRNSNCGERAHHNALEKRRRQRIRQSFESLRDSVPVVFRGKYKSSRSEILRNATEYIRHLKEANLALFRNIQRLRFENQQLEREMQTSKLNTSQTEELLLFEDERSWIGQNPGQWDKSLANDVYITTDAFKNGFESNNSATLDFWTNRRYLKMDVQEDITIHSEDQNLGSHSDAQYKSYSNDSDEFVDVETLLDEGL